MRQIVGEWESNLSLNIICRELVKEKFVIASIKSSFVALSKVDVLCKKFFEWRATQASKIVKDPTSIYTLFMQKLIIRFFVSFHFDPGLVFYHDSVVIIAES